MPPILTAFLTFIAPQVGSGLTGQAVTKYAIAQDDMRIQIPKVTPRGPWTDVRLSAGVALGGVGTLMMGMKSNIVRGVGALVMLFGGALLGSLGATELMREKALEFKQGKKTDKGRISGDTFGAEYDHPGIASMGADFCGDPSHQVYTIPTGYTVG